MARITVRNAYRWSGVLAGLVAGLAMGVFAMVVSAAQGNGFFAPLHLIASLIWGDAALSGGFWVALVGLLIHEVFSGAVGLVFSWIAETQESTAGIVTSGVLYSIVVWAVMTYAIIPWAMAPLYTNIMANKGWWFLGYVTFGATLALTPSIRRALYRSQSSSSQHSNISRAA